MIKNRLVVVINASPGATTAWVKAVAQEAQTRLDWIGYGNVAEVLYRGTPTGLLRVEECITHHHGLLLGEILQRHINGRFIPGEHGQLLAVTCAPLMAMESWVQRLEKKIGSGIHWTHRGNHGEVFFRGEALGQQQAFTTIQELAPQLEGQVIRWYHPQTGEAIV